MMYRLLLAWAVCFVAGSPLATAQRGQLTPALRDALQLSAEQAAAWESIQTETQNKRQALLGNGDMDCDERQQRLHKLHLESRLQITELLSAEQAAALKTFRQSERQQHQAAWAAVDKEAMRAAMRTYRQEHVAPVLKSKHAQLETVMSAEDKALLEDIRKMLRAERHESKGDRPQGAAAHGHHGQRRGGASLEAKYPEQYATLKAMSVRYAATIDQLNAELALQRESWRKEMQAIRQQYLPENLPAKGERPHEDYVPCKGQEEQRLEKQRIRFLLEKGDGK